MTVAVSGGDVRASMDRERRGIKTVVVLLLLQGLIKTVFHPERLQWSDFGSEVIFKDILTAEWLFQG